MEAKHFACKYCEKSFLRESAFLKHCCEEMKRHAELETARGQRAFMLYNEWMKAGKKSEQSQKAFVKSQYFKSFVKFSDFVRKARLKKVDKFIAWTRRKDFPPPMWTMPDVFGAWMAYVAHHSSPMDLVRDSLDALVEIAEEASVDVSEVFDVITPTEMVHLTLHQQLSPWALLNSSKFRKFYTSQMRGGDKVRFDAFVDGVRWAKTFEKHPRYRNVVRKLMSDIGL